MKNNRKKRVRNALQKLSAMAVGGDLTQAAEREVDGGGTLEWLAKEPRASHGGEKQGRDAKRKEGMEERTRRQMDCVIRVLFSFFSLRRFSSLSSLSVSR